MPEDKDKKKKPPGFVEMEIPDEVAEGTYSNAFHVVASPAEFVLDFGRVVPNRVGVKVHTRIVMTPLHAKQLALALNENVRRFEDQFGEIKIPKGRPGLGPTGFEQ
jgi:hypothetical protein